MALLRKIDELVAQYPSMGRILPVPGEKRRGASFPLFFLLLFLAGGLLWTPCPSLGADDRRSEDEMLAELLKQQEEALWQEAGEAVLQGDDDKAATLFFRYYKTFPAADRAEEALWQAAILNRDLALSSREPNWEKVKDLFRSLTIDFPESPHLAEAYYEVGNAYFHMHFYREAITYLGLFLKRFPGHQKAPRAAFFKARSLMEIGKLAEATAVFAELAASKDRIYSLLGLAGQAHVDFAREQYHDALAVYLKILRRNPNFYVHDPQILHNMGIANLRVGNGREGRRDLLHYLNLAENAEDRPEVMFELAESFRESGNGETAGKLYRQIMAEGKEDDRVVVLSRFRLAQVKEEREKTGREEMKPASDRPYQAVLDHYYRDPLSQDARFELVKRHWERQEYDKAYAMGKAYLRYETKEDQKEVVTEIMGRILVHWLEGLLDEKKYEEIYRLYKDEYPHVRAYKRGKLLFLVGRALEEMGLYDKASVVYYRALGLALTEIEMRSLYLHRAGTYLAAKDLKSAQRLLKYLRKIYAANFVIGEIFSLSGRLREMQDRPEDALDFYRMAVEAPAFAENLARYARDYLRLLFEEDEIEENAGILERFGRENWLPPGELQSWYWQLGDRYRREESWQKAREAFENGVAAGLPQDTETAQLIHLKLGEVLLALDQPREAVAFFEKALQGKNELYKKMAGEQLSQEKIRKAVKEAEAVLQE